MLISFSSFSDRSGVVALPGSIFLKVSSFEISGSIVGRVESKGPEGPASISISRRAKLSVALVRGTIIRVANEYYPLRSILN